MRKKYLFIIAGWHFLKNGLYETIEKLSHRGDIDVFIASHKAEQNVDDELLALIQNIPHCQIQFFENIGFDWGAYSQAIDIMQEKIHAYEYLFFMHDDIEIIDDHVIEVFSQFMEEHNLMVAGNCRNPQNHPFPKTHPQVIEWARLSAWKIEFTLERWSTVRGSFFVAKPAVFKKISKLPFKDGHDSASGNWSVVIFGGLITEHFGSASLRTISGQSLSSPYVIEYNRGVTEDISSLNQIEQSAYITDEYPLKIQIGCGMLYLGGYLNIAANDNGKADLFGNIMQFQFKPGSISECYLHRMLPYLEQKSAETLLRHIFEALREGGSLTIECSDLEKAAQHIIRYQSNYADSEKSLCHFYGQEKEITLMGTPIRWGYTPLTLTEKLKNSGFREIRIAPPNSHKAKRQNDLRIVAIKTSPDARCQISDLRKKKRLFGSYWGHVIKNEIIRINLLIKRLKSMRV